MGGVSGALVVMEVKSDLKVVSNGNRRVNSETGCLYRGGLNNISSSLFSWKRPCVLDWLWPELGSCGSGPAFFQLDFKVLAKLGLMNFKWSAVWETSGFVKWARHLITRWEDVMKPQTFPVKRVSTNTLGRHAPRSHLFLSTLNPSGPSRRIGGGSQRKWGWWSRGNSYLNCLFLFAVRPNGATI